MTATYDFFVIGGGTAGCVIARRLAEGRKFNVLLIEAGPSKRSPIFGPTSMAQLYAIGNPAYDWCYKAEPDKTRYNHVEHWTRGRVMGGSSSINGTIYIRGQKQDFDHWASLGNTGWSYEEVLPFFRKSENNFVTGANQYHGKGGLLGVSCLPSPHPLAMAFIEGGKECGIPFNSDFNGIQQNGIGLLQSTQKNGVRHDTDRAFLSGIKHHSNLKILTNTQVSRIIFEGKKAIGIECQKNGKTLSYSSRGEIILAAGVIESIPTIKEFIETIIAEAGEIIGDFRNWGMLES